MKSQQTRSRSSSSESAPASPPRTWRVSNSEALRKAFGSVDPGDRVELADGTYRGSFKLERSGTEEQRIDISGGPKAVLRGNPDRDTLVVDASHVDLSGFSIRGGKRCIMTHNADHNTWKGLDIGRSQAEAFHLRDNSSDNLIEGCSVHHAGLDPKRRGIGEGIYIGSSVKNWDTNASTGYRQRPDRSDRNRLIGNTIYSTTAESVDVKEGTRGTVLEGNVFDGDKICGENGAESQVALKGNDARASGNTYVDSSGVNDKLEGTALVKPVRGAPGWGRGNDISGEARRSTLGPRPAPSTGSADRGDSGDSAGGAWAEATASMAARILDQQGGVQARVRKGDELRIREGSKQRKTIDGQSQSWWRAMPAEDLGQRTERKGWIPARALKPPGSDSTAEVEEPVPSSDSGQALKTDALFPPGIVEELAQATGMDSEQWDNALDLFAKAEQDQERGWTHQPGEFYGSCERLDYDSSKRGFTIGAFGATTGGSEAGDAWRLFEEAGIDARKDLGYPNPDRFTRKVKQLGEQPAWQAAMWRWFIAEYVEPTMKALRSRGYTSALTIAAVTDCSFNQGNDGDHGTRWVLKQVDSAKSEEDFLRRFLDARDRVVDNKKDDFNANGNGKRRVQMYRHLLEQGHLDLKDCKEDVRSATEWRMR